MTDQERVDEVVALAKEHNVCNIRHTVNAISCNDGTPCCGGCKHLSKKGCTVEAHGCRFWFCDTAWALFPYEVQVRIHALLLAYEAQLWFRHDGFTITHHYYPQPSS